MNRITLKNRELKPYGTLEGSVSWDLEKPPKDLELRVFWHTRGRGTEEAGVHFELPLGGESSGGRAFSCVLPGEPWSMDGKLISIVWAAERPAHVNIDEMVIKPLAQASATIAARDKGL